MTKIGHIGNWHIEVEPIKWVIGIDIYNNSNFIAIGVLCFIFWKDKEEVRQKNENGTI